MGTAVAHQIGRHVHPATKTDTTTPAPATGIDYLALVRDRHTTALAQRVNHAAMNDPSTPTDGQNVPRQTDLLDLLDPTHPDYLTPQEQL